MIARGVTLRHSLAYNKRQKPCFVNPRTVGGKNDQTLRRLHFSSHPLANVVFFTSPPRFSWNSPLHPLANVGVFSPGLPRAPWNNVDTDKISLGPRAGR